MFFVLFILVLVLCAYLWSQRRPKNFPPGPWGFPVLGHLPRLGLEPEKTAAAWKQRYGPIVGVDFASFPAIIISDHALCRQAFANPAIHARPKFKIFKRAGTVPQGIAVSSGRTWREQAAFAARHLRQLRSMEVVIMEQLHGLVEEIRVEALAERPVLTYGRFNIPFFNTMWAIIAGRPFEPGDPIIRRFTTEIIDAMSTVNVFSTLSLFMPWFGDNFPTWLTRADRLESIFCNAGELMQPFVDQHFATHTPGQPRDFIDFFIDEIQRTDPADKESSFHSAGGKQSLVSTLNDLFIAGIETTGTTLTWICLLLATYQDVQERVVAEIESVLGSKKQTPSLSDRPRMPYTDAMLNEVFRFRTLVPIGAAHSTTDTVELGGYTIPKDTMVFINIWEANNNRDTWGDPENFRPERWLSADGSQVVERGRLLTFGTGKRNCLGEQLARDELFLFTVGLLQEFKVQTVPGAPAPSLEPSIGGTTQGPKPHELLFSLRNQ